MCRKNLGVGRPGKKSAVRRSAVYLRYGDKELNFLKERDAKLGDVIEKTGFIEREVDSDLFSSVLHHIIGQQISTKAQQTIWKRMCDAFHEITPQTIAGAQKESLQALGMSLRKAEYIQDFSRKILTKEFDITKIPSMTDEEAIAALSALKGVGVWTAEMILLFSLQRPDILSFSDLGILRGMRMLYQYKHIDRALFETHRKRLSPYGSVASLYYWEVASGKIPGFIDPAPRKK